MKILSSHHHDNLDSPSNGGLDWGLGDTREAGLAVPKNLLIVGQKGCIWKGNMQDRMENEKENGTVKRFRFEFDTFMSYFLLDQNA